MTKRTINLLLIASVYCFLKISIRERILQINFLKNNNIDDKERLNLF